MSSEAHILTAGLIAFVFLLVIVIIVWKLFARLIRFLWRNGHLFGDTAVVRIISLGVVAALFPDTVQALLRSPLLLFDALFAAFPAMLAHLQHISHGMGLLESAPTLNVIALPVQDLAQRIYQGLSRFLLELPLARTVLAFAMWVVTGNLLSLVRRSAGESPGEIRENYLVHYYRGLTPIARQNILLSIILLMGAYLSIAAIVAIPWLKQDEVPEDLAVDQLELHLRRVPVTKEDFDRRFRPDHGADFAPFVVINAFLSEVEGVRGSAPAEEGAASQDADEIVDVSLADTVISGTATRSNLRSLSDDEKYLVSLARRELEWRSSQWHDLLSRWRTFHGDAFNHQERVFTNARDHFATHGLTQMSRQERAVYFQDIAAWYRRRIDDTEYSLERSRMYIDEHNGRLQRWASNLQQDLVADLENLRGGDAGQDGPFDMTRSHTFQSLYGPGYIDVSPQIYDGSLFRIPVEFYHAPMPPEPGLGWGPFGFVARWLLRTRSMPLALITGMLGFGILGAAISTFVREEARPTEGKHIPGLAGIIIRGVSAAIVIFLAVEGGLSLFSSSTHELNAYVLFFTCLVGAVFSEHVWEWAVIRLRGSLGQNGNKADEPDQSSEADRK